MILVFNMYYKYKIKTCVKIYKYLIHTLHLDTTLYNTTTVNDYSNIVNTNSSLVTPLYLHSTLP